MKKAAFQNFGDALRAVREAGKPPISQEALADLLGLKKHGQSTVSRWELKGAPMLRAQYDKLIHLMPELATAPPPTFLTPDCLPRGRRRLTPRQPASVAGCPAPPAEGFVPVTAAPRTAAPPVPLLESLVLKAQALGRGMQLTVPETADAELEIKIGSAAWTGVSVTETAERARAAIDAELGESVQRATQTRDLLARALAA